MPAAETPLGEPKKAEPTKPSAPLPAKTASGAALPTQPPVFTPERGPEMASDQANKAASPTGSNPDLMAKTPVAPDAQVIPLIAEIVNARTSDVPKDGKVEMQLTAVVRDPDGNPITISKVDSWKVDGKQQLDAEGRLITTNSLPVNLTEGVHRVSLNATAVDGRPVAAEAAVNVAIAVREESTVKLKQLKQP